MSRRLAGAGLSRRVVQKPTGAAPFTPASISSALQVAWFRADQLRTMNADRVSAWGDLWGLQAGYIQAGGSAQPIYEAAGLNGQPSIANDDGARKMTMTLSPTIGAGVRTYAFLWLQVTTVGNLYGWTIQDTNGANALLSIAQDATNWQTWRQETAAVFESLSVTPRNTNITRVELGYTAGGTATQVLNAVSNNSVRTGTPAVALNQSRLFARYDNNNGIRMRVAEIIILKGEPDATLKSQVRAYGLARYGV